LTRVLYVHGGLLRYGGTESYMMNYCRHFDRARITVDFAVHGEGTGAYDEEVLAMGGRIYHLPVKGQDYRGNTRALRRLISAGGYRAVHSHIDAGNAHVLRIAKACGVPLRVAHSHNTRTQSDSRLRRWYNALEKRRIPGVATHLFACSDAAGRWLYGRCPFTVINNAIDLEKYRPDADLRAQLRGELGVADGQPLIGHVGRFSYQKNHQKLIDIFAAFVKLRPDAVLALIGEGETRPAAEKQAAACGLTDSIRFVGTTSRVAAYMQAFDAFVLPSRFEGLAVALVEAQAAGLPCFTGREAMPPESDITGLVRFFPPEAGPGVWAEALAEAVLPDAVRTGTAADIAAAGYDIRQEAGRLQRFYETGILGMTIA